MGEGGLRNISEGNWGGGLKKFTVHGGGGGGQENFF